MNNLPVKAKHTITYHLDGVFRTIERGTDLQLINPDSLPLPDPHRACARRSNKKDPFGRQWSIVKRPDGGLLVVQRADLRRVS